MILQDNTSQEVAELSWSPGLRDGKFIFFPVTYCHIVRELPSGLKGQVRKFWVLKRECLTLCREKRKGIFYSLSYFYVSSSLFCTKVLSRDVTGPASQPRGFWCPKLNFPIAQLEPQTGLLAEEKQRWE